MATISINDDYASVTVGIGRFYYGYEVVDASGDWCFQATLGGKPITISANELEVSDVWSCAECLLAGIAALVERGVLKYGC